MILKNFIILALFFSSAHVLSQDWIEGRFLIQFEKGTANEKSVKIVIQKNEKQLFAQELSEENPPPHPATILSASEVREIFRATLKVMPKINCATMKQLIICHTPQELIIKETKIKIPKGFFGIVPDLGLISVSKINK